MSDDERPKQQGVAAIADLNLGEADASHDFISEKGGEA
jgi:hypothetical protein